MKPTRPFHQTPVITIDGPTASGKGTVAAVVAATLGFHLLDSGALYRLTALASARYNIEPDHGDALAELVAELHITFREGLAQLDGVDVSTEIRAEEIGKRASAIAVHPQVRTALIARQRAFRRPPGLVATAATWEPLFSPTQHSRYSSRRAQKRAPRGGISN